MKKYLVLTIALAFSLILAGSAQAGTANQLKGWAVNLGPWSQTVGWLSFFSGDLNTGTNGIGNSSVTYGVTVSTSTNSSPPNIIGTFDGYAWSSNVGWVSFKPTDTGVCGTAASIDLSTGAVTGWARVVSGSVASGADGCINLSGTVSGGGTYGVSLGVTPSDPSTYGKFSGFAWGSTNVGWLSFAGVICPGCVGGAQPFSATCTSDPSSLGSEGGTVWFTANPSGGTAPYKYYWKNSLLENQSDQVNIIYKAGNADFDGPTLTVKDSATLTNSSFSPTCPSVRVGTGDVSNVGACPSPIVSQYTCSPGQAMSQSSSGNIYSWICTVTGQSAEAASCSYIATSGSGNLRLAIGAPAATLPDNTNDPTTGFTAANYKLYTVSRGRSFQLKWNIATATNYESCTITNDKGANWSLSPGVVSDRNASIPTTGKALGQYIFTLSCKTGGATPTTDKSQAKLIIRNSGIQEF